MFLTLRIKRHFRRNTPCLIRTKVPLRKVTALGSHVGSVCGKSDIFKNLSEATSKQHILDEELILLKMCFQFFSKRLTIGKR